jgi:hypothetical protein
MNIANNVRILDRPTALKIPCHICGHENIFCITRSPYYINCEGAITESKGIKFKKAKPCETTIKIELDEAGNVTATEVEYDPGMPKQLKPPERLKPA